MRKTIIFRYCIAIMPVAVLLLFGCMHTDTVSRAAREAFETYAVDPAFHYYYAGSDTHPVAVIRIDADYQLQTRLWRRVTPTKEQLKSLVSGLQFAAAEYSVPTGGRDIILDSGRDIGDWYSALEARPVVERIDEKTVTIYTPPFSSFEELRPIRPHFFDEDR